MSLILPMMVPFVRRWIGSEVRAQGGSIGPAANNDKHMNVVNRVVTWAGKGCSVVVKHEVDPRHSEIASKQLGSQDATFSTSFAVRNGTNGSD